MKKILLCSMLSASMLLQFGFPTFAQTIDDGYNDYVADTIPGPGSGSNGSLSQNTVPLIYYQFLQVNKPESSCNEIREDKESLGKVYQFTISLLNEYNRYKDSIKDEDESRVFGYSDYFNESLLINSKDIKKKLKDKIEPHIDDKYKQEIDFLDNYLKKSEEDREAVKTYYKQANTADFSFPSNDEELESLLKSDLLLGLFYNDEEIKGILRNRYEEELKKTNPDNWKNEILRYFESAKENYNNEKYILFSIVGDGIFLTDDDKIYTYQDLIIGNRNILPLLKTYGQILKENVNLLLDESCNLIPSIPPKNEEPEEPVSEIPPIYPTYELPEINFSIPPNPPVVEEKPEANIFIPPNPPATIEKPKGEVSPNPPTPNTPPPVVEEPIEKPKDPPRESEPPKKNNEMPKTNSSSVLPLLSLSLLGVLSSLLKKKSK